VTDFWPASWRVPVRQLADARCYRRVTQPPFIAGPLAFSIQLLRTETTISAFRLELAAKQQHSGIHR